MTRLSDLSLPRKIYNTLWNARIHSVEHLTSYKEAELLDIYGIGPGTVTHIREALAKYAEEVERKIRTALQEVSGGTGIQLDTESGAGNLPSTPVSVAVDARASGPELSLRDALETSVKSLKKRDAEAFLLRLGYAGPPLRLEDIGKQLGITRERARQLVRRAREQLEMTASWPRILRERLTALLKDREEALYLDLMAAEDSWFAGFDEKLPFLGQVLEVFSDDAVAAWQLHGRTIVAGLTEAEWQDLQRTALQTLSVQSAARLSEGDVRLVVEAIASTNGARSLVEDLWDKLSDRLHFVVDAVRGERYLYGTGGSVDAVIAAILEESETPLSIEEIADAYAQRTGKQRATNALRAGIAGAGGFPFPGRTYGLSRHIPLSADDKGAVLEMAEDIVTESGQTKQWHASEIVEEIRRRRPDLPDDLDPYWIDCLLHHSDRVDDLGRMVSVARVGPRQGTLDRLGIAALCVEALLDAGRPLSSTDLIKAIAQRRGLGEHLPLWPNSKMIRLGRGVWGLIDRDIGLSAAEREDFLRSLRRALSERQKAFHMSELGEVCGVFPSLSPVVAWGLAEQDERFQVGPGQYVGLSEWIGMNRPTVRDAVLRAMISLPVGSPESAIVVEVRQLTERIVPVSEIRAVLAACGYAFEPGSSGWAKSGP